MIENGIQTNSTIWLNLVDYTYSLSTTTFVSLSLSLSFSLWAKEFSRYQSSILTVVLYISRRIEMNNAKQFCNQRPQKTDTHKFPLKSEQFKNLSPHTNKPISVKNNATSFFEEIFPKPIGNQWLLTTQLVAWLKLWFSRIHDHSNIWINSMRNKNANALVKDIKNVLFVIFFINFSQFCFRIGFF